MRGEWYRRLAVTTALVLAVVARPGTARAQSDEIQVYDAEIAPQSIVNLTWHNNFIAAGARTAAEPGGIVPHHSLNGVTEWAYGLTDWFEGGLYLPLYSRPGSGAFVYNGFKLRALFVEPDAANHRFVYGVNFEFSVNAEHWDPHRYTAEIRPIIGWHLGRVDVIFNPILDSAYGGWSSLVFAPATRIACNLRKSWIFAVEEYAELGPLRHFHGLDSQSHQLFGVVDHTRGRLNIEAGVGFGLTRATDHRVLKLILSIDLNQPGR